VNEPPVGLSEADFESIEAAVMETARGRWFLAEYARRCRAEDTIKILGAVERLEAHAADFAASERGMRLQAEQAMGLVRQLAEIVKSARARPDAGAIEPPAARLPVDRAADAPTAADAPPGAKGALESRLAALANLDALSLAQKLKLFR